MRQIKGIFKTFPLIREIFSFVYGVVFPVMAAGGYVMNNIDSGYNEF